MMSLVAVRPYLSTDATQMGLRPGPVLDPIKTLASSISGGARFERRGLAVRLGPRSRTRAGIHAGANEKRLTGNEDYFALGRICAGRDF